MAYWRFRAMLVAWFDIVLDLIELALAILTLVGIIFLNKQNIMDFVRHQQRMSGNSISTSSAQKTVPVARIFLWIFLVLKFFFIFLQIYAAIKLKNATDKGRDPHEAIKMAQKWQVITWFFLLLTLIAYLLQAEYIVLVIVIIFRFLNLLVVHMFKIELETEGNAPILAK